METKEELDKQKAIQTDQRYYHFILLKEVGANGLNSCIEYLEKINENKNPLERDGQNLRFLKIRKDKKYSTSSKLDFSIKKNGDAPFLYDIVYSKIKAAEYYVLILVFPFTEFAKDITETLRREIGILRFCQFYEVDIDKAIAYSIENSFQSVFLDSSRISSVEVSIKGEKYLSSVKLMGDNPLQSDTYDELIKIQNLGKSKLDEIEDKAPIKYENKKIVMSCELMKENAASQKNLRAKIHTDRFGNFKFYLHQEGVNLQILPYFYRHLENLDCLKPANTNPLLREMGRE